MNLIITIDLDKGYFKDHPPNELKDLIFATDGKISDLGKSESFEIHDLNSNVCGKVRLDVGEGSNEMICPKCKGSGSFDSGTGVVFYGDDCTACDGEGKITK